MNASRVAKAYGHGLAERIYDVTHRFAIGPDLAVMHGMDALAKYFQRLVPEYYATGTATKCIYDQFVVAGMEEHHAAGTGGHGPHLTQETVASQRIALKIGTNHEEIRLILPQQGEGGIGMEGRPDNVDMVSLHSKRALHQLTI